MTKKTVIYDRRTRKVLSVTEMPKHGSSGVCNIGDLCSCAIDVPLSAKPDGMCVDDADNPTKLVFGEDRDA